MLSKYVETNEAFPHLHGRTKIFDYSSAGGSLLIYFYGSFKVAEIFDE